MTQLPDRPAISRPRARTPARHPKRWARQPRLGLAGLSLVLPVAVLLALAAGGAEPSLLVLGPIVTFSLPVVAMVAFWWNDWPGTMLRPAWSGWADTVLIIIAAIVLTVLGQAAVGHADLSAIFDPTPASGDAATFPETMPVAGAAFVAMLQLTLVSEGWPLRQHIGRIAAGFCALVVAWVVALGLYIGLLGGRPFTGLGADASRAVLSGGEFGALLTLIGAWQVWVFVLWGGWPVRGISERWQRILGGNAVVLAGGGVSCAVMYSWVGLRADTVSAVAGAFVASGLLVGMLFEGALARRFSAAWERVAGLGLTLVCTAVLYVLLGVYAESLVWDKVTAADWVSHVGLNAIGVGIILHVAIGRRWPFASSS